MKFLSIDSSFPIFHCLRFIQLIVTLAFSLFLSLRNLPHRHLHVWWFGLPAAGRRGLPCRRLPMYPGHRSPLRHAAATMPAGSTSPPLVGSISRATASPRARAVASRYIASPPHSVLWARSPWLPPSSVLRTRWPASPPSTTPQRCTCSPVRVAASHGVVVPCVCSLPPMASGRCPPVAVAEEARTRYFQYSIPPGPAHCSTCVAQGIRGMMTGSSGLTPTVCLGFQTHSGN